MTALYHPLQLKNTVIPGNIFLAPLAGFTDRAFREMCIEYGADFTYTEMVSCEGIIRKNEKTIKLLTPGEKESLFGIQIFTAKPESAFKSLEFIEPLKPGAIDINCGCPVPKVVKSGAGSALLKTPKKIEEIVQTLSSHTDIPITVKIRLGWDSDSINFLETAEAAARGGAAAVCLHARTRSQGYSGKADISAIKLLKEQSSIPVIGSGDLFSPESAKNMVETTGCDGVLFARGAIGNPFIFQQTKALFSGGKNFCAPNPLQKITAAAEHLKKCVYYSGEILCCKEMKKHLCAYTKSIPGGGELRKKLVQAKNISQFEEFFTSYSTLYKE